MKSFIESGSLSSTYVILLGTKFEKILITTPLKAILCLFTLFKQNKTSQLTVQNALLMQTLLAFFIILNQELLRRWICYLKI